MTVRFGEFLLDSDERRLLRGGKEVRLPPKAFDLLCTLVARRPHVVPKAQLMARIWPATFVVEANLNVLVGEVRRALGDDPRSPRFVRTAHGVGYAFCAGAVDLGAPAAAASSGIRCWLAWKNRTFALSPGDNVVGRDPRSDVWLDHAGVSRRHARIRIECDMETALLDDLDSTNGTFLDGQRVVAQATLHDGDVIVVGPVELKFRVWSDTASRTKRIRGKASPPRL